MKFWEKLLRTISKRVARKTLQKFQANSMERVLKNSLQVIDAQTLAEMRVFLIKQQTAEGGFADKGGNCDLYYSLFGCYVAEGLHVPEVMPLLKQYVKNVVQTHDLKGVYIHSAAILHAKLFGAETLPSTFIKRLDTDLYHGEKEHTAYSGFLGLMTFYYLGDYLGLYRIQKKLKSIKSNSEMPCSVTAAQLVLRHCFCQPTKDMEKRLYAFYRNDGSFSAINQAPIGDLLSTAVALYALRFVNSDIRMIKPDCLNYVDSLYSEGGFCGTAIDTSLDVEYTFYGLLALGSLV
ncbi:MAG: hypothetical protein WCX31_16675 [Salinivirgaceae bacterium]